MIINLITLNSVPYTICHMTDKKRETYNYIFAGKAIFTVVSSKMGWRYTYKITQTKSNKDNYTIKVLYGSDNTEDYKHIGILNRRLLSLESYNIENGQIRLLMSFIHMLLNPLMEWPETCEFYKSDKCAACGRLLTTPESIESGYGPRCYSRIFTIKGE